MIDGATGLHDPQTMILEEIADPVVTRDSVAITYAFMIVQDETDRISEINGAIIERWSRSALEYIKRVAWARAASQMLKAADREPPEWPTDESVNAFTAETMDLDVASHSTLVRSALHDAMLADPIIKAAIALRDGRSATGTTATDWRAQRAVVDAVNEAGRAAPMATAAATRTCRTCHRTLSLEQFSRYRTRRDEPWRPTRQCIACSRAQRRDRHASYRARAARGEIGEHPAPGALPAAPLRPFLTAAIDAANRAGDGMLGVEARTGVSARAIARVLREQRWVRDEMADRLCVGLGVRLDDVWPQGRDTPDPPEPAARRVRRPPCPCGCGTPDGFCDEHRARLHAIRDDPDQGLYGVYAPGHRGKRSPPMCCNPWCFSPRERGHRFCEACEAAGFNRGGRGVTARNDKKPPPGPKARRGRTARSIKALAGP